MQPITPSLPFLAFPTAKVLAEFQPVRGLLVEIPVPEGSKAPIYFRSLGDLLDLELHDPRPLVEAICQEMGYDTAKVAAGEGETGVHGHSWVTYCDARMLPMLVRWTAGEANLLVTLVETVQRGNSLGGDLRLTILGDEAAKPIMRRLGVALSRFGITKRGYCTGRAELEGRNRTFTLPELQTGRMSTSLTIGGDAQGEITPQRARELPDLLLSCDCIGTRSEAGLHQAGEAMLTLHSRNPFQMRYAADRLIAPEMVDLIHHASVQDVYNLTTADLKRRYGSERACNSMVYLDLLRTEMPHTQGVRAFIAGLLHEIERVGVHEHTPLSYPGLPFGTQTLRRGPVSYSEDFSKPEQEVFAGVEPMATSRGPTSNLVNLAFQVLEGAIWALEGLSEKELSKPPQGGWTAEPLRYMKEEQGNPRYRITNCDEPTWGIHQGLPILADKSAIVWRRGDEQALAIDFAYHTQTQGVHLARFRRCRVPGRKGEALS